MLHLDQFYPGRAQQLAWSRTYLLRVREMARVLIRCLHAASALRRAQADFGEVFGDVADFAHETFCVRGGLRCRVTREEVGVILHRRAAAGGVRDDGVAVRAIK